MMMISMHLINKQPISLTLTHHVLKKLFTLKNSLCGKKQCTPLPDRGSVEILVNKFGKDLNDKVDAIQSLSDT